MKQLIAHQLPLQGKHLIEASAGTGKTFNITRIYLRLLLEKKLSVQEILVMTFTKDATEELKGRIEQFIRLALNDWQQLVTQDEYFKVLESRVEEHERQLLLTKALLFLDEAAIFTIHGFCKRILTQHAFLTGVTFNAQMEADVKALVQDVCQDWYRNLAASNQQHFLQVESQWATPLNFIRQFTKAIYQDCELDVVSEDDIHQTFFQLAQQALYSLEQNYPLIAQCLIDNKKGKDHELRASEYQALVSWLTKASNDFSLTEEAIPHQFIDGKRFSKSPDKAQLIQIFAPIKQIKEQQAKFVKNVEKARALVIARAGIYWIREQLKRSKQHQGLLTFDDLIATLAEQLGSNNLDKTDQQALLSARLFEQYPAALVDEFQDTDPKQFAILQAIYQQQETAALYLIGDPKQAIYGFRGGDVFAYLNARNSCQYHWVMDTNWRSSAGVIQGYNRLFYGNDLSLDAKDVFSYSIEYYPVKPSPNASNKTLNDDQYNDVSFVYFEHEKTALASFRKPMAIWAANEIKRLLLTEPSLKAKDIALLVRDGTEAADIKQALNDVALASVYLSNRSNLWQSEQGKELLTLLKGVLFVEDKQLFSAALTSPLLGITPKEYLSIINDDAKWNHHIAAFIKLRDEWLQTSFITMALKLLHDHVKVDDQQDRILTNCLHLFELLQAASQRYREPSELLHWFEQQTLADLPDIEAELRLESEEDLIRIITQHGSKGLEYPIVFVPFATRHKDPLKVARQAVGLIEYHGDDGKLMMSLDGYEQAKRTMAQEQYAESIRLLYVAITRAEKRCYVLIAPFDKCELSPLGRTLKCQEKDELPTILSSMAQHNNSIGYYKVTDEVIPDLTKVNQQKEQKSQEVEFVGQIERDWWLSSFSALSRNLKHTGISIPDRDFQPKRQTSEHPQEIINGLRFDIAKGAKTGNLLHDILELVDFSNPNWQRAIKWPLTRYGDLGEYGEQDLIQWLEEVIHSPLIHNDQTELCLASLPFNKTLRECEFYFPLAAVNTYKLSQFLNEHRLQDETTTDHKNLVKVFLPSAQKLQGMMHGFIDLLFEFEGKFYICDYKSNFIEPNYESYNRNNLKNNIEAHHYDLQYLIYGIALHRYLSSKVKNYDVNQHFGGVYYLYLRGMTTKQEYRGNGVYYRSLLASDILTLDAIFSDTTIGSNPEISEPV